MASTPAVRNLHTLVNVGPSKEAGASELGLFAKRTLPTGTILPYPCIAEPVRTEDRKYNLAAEYCDMRTGKYTSIPTLELNGDPALFADRYDAAWTFAARINEPSKHAQNCHMIVNPALNKNSIWQSFMNETLIVAAFAVTSEPVQQGAELLTHYGDGYSRSYRVKPADNNCAKIDMCLAAVCAAVKQRSFVL